MLPDEDDLSVMLLGDMLLLLMWLWGLSGGKLLPSTSGRLPLPMFVIDVVVVPPLLPLWWVAATRELPFTVTTADELLVRLLLELLLLWLLFDDCVPLLLLLLMAVEEPWLLVLQREARSILDPDRRTSRLARRHLSLSICTWRQRQRGRQRERVN